MNENILNSQWIPTKVRSPDKDGYYLVTIKGLGTNNDYIHIYKFAKDLNKVNRDDFRVKKGASGWYSYDSEYGYYSVNGVTAWMPLPEVYKENENG